MFLGSLPEMHLTSYGWMLYNNIWGMLAFLGLAAFPFAYILISTVVDALQKHGLGFTASKAAFNSIFPSFLVMFAIYGAACIPVVPLDVDTWEYADLCTNRDGNVQQLSQTMSPGNTGTPLDQATQLTQANTQYGDVRVPWVWDLVMRLGAGVSRAINSGGACPTNTSYLDAELRKMEITDQALRAEVGQFAADCYLPARGRFNKAIESGTLTTVPTINDAVTPNQYFAASYREWSGNNPPNQENEELFSRRSDPSYIGSRFFLATPGLYAPATPGQLDTQVGTLQASVPIAGWTYEPIRDCNRTTATDTDGNPWCTSPRNPDFESNNGYPQCDEWWTNDDIGLQTKLRQEAEASIWLTIDGAPITPSDALNTVITNINPNAAKSDNWLADKMVATVLVNDSATQKSIGDKISSVYDKIFSGDEKTITSNATDLEDAWGVIGSIGGLLVGGFAALSSGASGAAASVAVAGNLALSAIDFYTTSWIVRHAYPIAQAYLTLFFVAMLPFVMIGSMYDLGRLLQLGLLFMAIQFLSPWRFVVEYLDERLFEIMFPDKYGELGTDLILKTPERILVDITTTSMYTVFPFILLWLVTLAGADAARGAGEAMSKLTMPRVSATQIVRTR